MPTLLPQPRDNSQNSSHLWLNCAGCFGQEAATPATVTPIKWSSLVFTSRPMSLVLHADGCAFQIETTGVIQDVLMSLWVWMDPLTRSWLITWYKAGLFLDSFVCCENLGLQIKHQNSYGCLSSCFMCPQAFVFLDCVIQTLASKICPPA